MNEAKDDIFNHIKEVLQNHEAPYDEGAWERFAAKKVVVVKKNPVISLWKWSAAAAAILIGIILISRNIYTSSNSLPVAAVELPKSNPSNDINSANINSVDLAKLPKSTTISPQVKNKNNTKIVAASTKSVIVKQEKINIPQTEHIATPVTNPPVIEPVQTEIARVTPQIKEEQPIIDFWTNKVVEHTTPQNKPSLKENSQIIIATTTPAPSKKKTKHVEASRWQPSVFVSPIFGDLGVELGYGFSLGFAVNSKVKISSGIAHAKMSASRSYSSAAETISSGTSVMNNATTASTANITSLSDGSTSGRSGVASQYITALEQIEGSVSGIDIPVEVNYNINKKFYATAGMSGMIVIKDNKTYTYLDSRNERISVESNSGVIKENRSVLFQDQNVTNESLQNSANKTPFLGFYNLSVGYKQKLGTSNALSLEPFVKIPVKNTSQQQLNFLGTGIRLKFDF